ncbi:hypothetical protein EDB80DRAFT_592848, partial [Ilyonectria destructans]
ASPKDLQTLKHFSAIIASTMVGRLDPNDPRPTDNSIRVVMRRFCSAWERENNDYIPEAFKRSMCPYIKGPLTEVIPIKTGKSAHKPPTYLTIANFVNMQEFHWVDDFHDYVHDAIRVDNTNLLNPHCFTSARQQEVCQAVYQVRFQLERRLM